MARVLVNNTSLRVAIELTIGALPGSPSWNIVEFDTIGAYGAIITTTVRRPISQDRGRKKGTVTDLDSTVEYETDLTVDAFTLFAEGFMFAEYANVEFDLTNSKLKGSALNVTATGYAFDAVLSTFTNGTLLASKAVFGAAGAISLFFAKGYAVAGNNGLKPLTVDLAAADSEVVVSGLAIETAPAEASLELVGVRTDDLTLTITVGPPLTATLVSAADVDWTVLGLVVGQWIHIGSQNASGVVQNAYSTNNVFGYARITAITTTTLTLDKLDANIGIAGPHGPEAVDVMFGRFARNVIVTADSDDNRFLERSYQFEVAYPDLGGTGNDEYEYAIGNFANEMGFNLPLTDKSTLSMGFIGTNSDDIVIEANRKSNASTAVAPIRTTAFNTSSDIISLTTDVVSLVSDVCFKSLTLSILNNISPEKCLGTLGAVFVNHGLYEANLEGQMLFTNKQIINAIKNNTTVTFTAILANEDGAIVMDIPEMTFSGGAREFPIDQSVLVNLTGASFTSSQFGFDLGISLFSSVPGVITDS